MIFSSIAKGVSFYTPGGIGIVDVKDVVKAMMILMTNPIVNESYVLVGKNIYYKELLSEISLRLNRKAPNKKVSKWILTIISKLDWLLAFLIGKNQKLPISTVHSLYRTSFYDGSKIMNELNFNFTPYKETLERVAKNFLNKNK